MKREVLMMKGNGVRGVWFFSWFDVSCVSAIFCDFSLRRFQALNVL